MLRAACLALAAGCVAGQASPSDYEVTSLPGLTDAINFKQYAGYMPLGDADGTQLFFWFVESQRSPSQDPVVLWMNGGPGSSSVNFGFWQEHGPFRLQPDGQGSYKPTLYNESWNKIANVIYVEAPAGVGFSFSNNTAHYKDITDAQSSHDNYLFLVAFFKVFAQFKANDFYITAESYGGHYGPTLAEQLIDNNSDLNMKGLLIGNPGINSDWYYNVNEYAWITYCWSHALIPSIPYFAAVEACGWNDFFSNCSRNFTQPTAACEAATSKAANYIPSPLDPYNVLAPTCHGNEEQRQAGEDFVAQYTPHLLRFREKYNLSLEYNPCISTFTPKYMNRPDVMKAIHADKYATRIWPSLPSGWSYNQGFLGEKNDIALLYPKFFSMRPKWKQIVISGDADSAVPFMGTERWLRCLERPVTNDWRRWILNKDVAGMVIDFEGISFATVKGCGHTIPTYCPAAGFAFFQNWLTDTWN
ncbi:Serine carboxypeptidase 24 [Diplonema papillatum]|nr:Serine carboxypeptidase 24 [Diplonema papillatum]KAJ9466476.1 Serine carboxypeptidase 24 [Diplonema papillatum]